MSHRAYAFAAAVRRNHKFTDCFSKAKSKAAHLLNKLMERSEGSSRLSQRPRTRSSVQQRQRGKQQPAAASKIGSWDHDSELELVGPF